MSSIRREVKQKIPEAGGSWAQGAIRALRQVEPDARLTLWAKFGHGQAQQPAGGEIILDHPVRKIAPAGAGKDQCLLQGIVAGPPDPRREHMEAPAVRQV